MKHLFVMLTAALTTAVFAAAQVPATSFAVEKNGLANYTPGRTDSALGYIRILSNPASGMVVLMVDSKNPNDFAQGEAIVYSNEGYPVAKRPFTTGTNDIYISNLRGGLYFLRLVAKTGQNAVKEFVVTR